VSSRRFLVGMEHRLLGRVIGIAYLLPFLWFMWCGVLRPTCGVAMADLRLGALQARSAVDGSVGIVAAGEVSHIASPPIWCGGC